MAPPPSTDAQPADRQASVAAPPNAEPPDRPAGGGGHGAHAAASVEAADETATDETAADETATDETHETAVDATDKSTADAAADAARRAARARRADAWSAAGETILDALVATGRATGRVFGAMGGAAGEAWRAVDPDLRRHLLQLPLLGLTHLSPRDAVVRPLPDDGHPPVLFVHGLAGHPGNFTPMRVYFRALGRTRTYSIGFPPGLSFDAMAARLKEAAAEVSRVNGLAADAPVQIVAHSMGGIVTRVALLDPAFAARVVRVVTLGTPHQGTHAARFAATMQTLDLRPGSSLLKRLDATWGLPSTPLTALWSPADMLILPSEHATMPGAEAIRLDGFTHFSWLIDPRTWQAAWEILDRDRALFHDLQGASVQGA